jgi:hypothetical protein
MSHLSREPLHAVVPPLPEPRGETPSWDLLVVPDGALDEVGERVLEASRELFREFRQLPLMAVIRAVLHAHVAQPGARGHDVAAAARVQLLTLGQVRPREG